jgi:hypothetical protein
LQNSGISSPASTSPSQSPAEPTRKRFALTGPSIAIDSRIDAVRPDLADVRLADRVFAPHYAAPMPREIRDPVPLRAGPRPDAEVLATLSPGEIFEVLELAGTNAWGVAPGFGLVGYIDAASLEAMAA